jgi:hypothetical protein
MFARPRLNHREHQPWITPEQPGLDRRSSTSGSRCSGSCRRRRAATSQCSPPAAGQRCPAAAWPQAPPAVGPPAACPPGAKLGHRVGPYLLRLNRVGHERQPERLADARAPVGARPAPGAGSRVASGRARAGRRRRHAVVVMRALRDAAPLLRLQVPASAGPSPADRGSPTARSPTRPTGSSTGSSAASCVAISSSTISWSRPRGRVKIADFGIAKATGRPGEPPRGRRGSRNAGTCPRAGSGARGRQVGRSRGAAKVGVGPVGGHGTARRGERWAAVVLSARWLRAGSW